MPVRLCRPGVLPAGGLTRTDGPDARASGPSEYRPVLLRRRVLPGQLAGLVAGERLPQHAVRRRVDRALEAVERRRVADEHEHRGVGGKARLELVDHGLERALVADTDGGTRERAEAAP